MIEYLLTFAIVVVARPKFLCLDMRRCKDIYRPLPPSLDYQQDPYDHPLDQYCLDDHCRTRFLVPLDAAMYPGEILLG